MKVLHAVQKPVLIVHQAVEHVAGASRIGIVVSHLELLGFPPFQIQQPLEDRSLFDMLLRPLPQPP